MWLLRIALSLQFGIPVGLLWLLWTLRSKGTGGRRSTYKYHAPHMVDREQLRLSGESS